MAGSRFDESFVTLPSFGMDPGYVLQLAGITHPDPSYRIRRDSSHDIFVLEYVISGRGYLRIGGHDYTLRAGDVYCIQPQIEHEYGADPSDPWEKIWFNLSGPLPNGLCDAYSLRGCFYFPQCPLYSEFKQGLEILREGGADASLKFALQMHKILAMLGKHRSEYGDIRRSPEGLALRAFLESRWNREVTLRQLCSLIRKSPAQTLRIFRNDWGTTPYVYVQKLRLRFAGQYLENTDESVKEIAALCGFCDEFYFSNWFKGRTGVSPAAFRRRFRVKTADAHMDQGL